MQAGHPPVIAVQRKPIDGVVATLRAAMISRRSQPPSEADDIDHLTFLGTELEDAEEEASYSDACELFRLRLVHETRPLLSLDCDQQAEKLGSCRSLGHGWSSAHPRLGHSKRRAVLQSFAAELPQSRPRLGHVA